MTVPSWSQLLSALAEVPYDTARGAVRWRQPDEDDLDRVAEQGEAQFWFAAPDRWRVEDDRGPVLVQDAQWLYRRDAEGRLQRRPRRESWHGDPLEGLGSGTDLAEQFRSGSDDFHEPMGPATAVSVAGRPAWAVVLAPPVRKPYPLTVALDEETGALVRMAALEGRFVREMTRFEPGVPVEPERFLWTGPYRTDWYDEEQASRAARTWAAQARVPVPRWWPSGLRYDALDGDPGTGAFVVHLEVADEPLLARWPRDAEPPGLWLGHARHRHSHRWTDDLWEWGLAVERPLAEDDLQRVIASLPDR